MVLSGSLCVFLQSREAMAQEQGRGNEATCHDTLLGLLVSLYVPMHEAMEVVGWDGGAEGQARSRSTADLLVTI